MAVDEVFENALHCTEAQATRSNFSVIKMQNILAPTKYTDPVWVSLQLGKYGDLLDILKFEKSSYST